MSNTKKCTTFVSLDLSVGVLGVEPRTSSLSVTRSNHLSYTPARLNYQKKPHITSTFKQKHRLSGAFEIKYFVPAASYFPSRVSSLQRGLTSVFGMRTGVTLATNHQNKIFTFFGKKHSLYGTAPLSRISFHITEHNNNWFSNFLIRIDKLVRLDSTHYCAYI